MQSLRKLFFCPILLIAILSNLAPSLADANKIFNENSRSVVVIVALDKQGNPISQGSGFVVRSDGAIITNYHVISGAEDIQVKAGKEILPVEGIIYIDKENDLVILKAKAKALPAVRLGDIAKVSVGEKVYVIGSPQGLENTISDGILSGIREVDPKRKIIQITAPVSEGSSGGPVFNDNGEVIGIVTFLIKESQNLNFAMPINVLKSRIADKKVTSFQKAQIGKYQKTADYWFNLGYFYAESGLYNKAIEAYKQVIRIKPDDAAAHYNLGVQYAKLRRYAEEIEAYKQAIRIKPDFADAYYGLGLAYGMLDRYAEEIEAYKQAIRIRPDFAEAYNTLGVAYLYLRRYAEAMEAYKQAIRIKPDDAAAHKKLGLAYCILGRSEEAIESCKQAIRIKPNDAEAHYILGLTYVKLGRVEEVIEAYKQAIRIKPDYTEVHYSLGHLYIALGRKSDALEEYKILKELDKERANKLFDLIYR